LKEEHRLRGGGDRFLLKKMSEPKRDLLKWDWRGLSREIHFLYSPSYIVWMIKSKAWNRYSTWCIPWREEVHGKI
jgi:hypothetical protein